MDSADDLSSHWLVRTTSTWDYGVALYFVASFEGSSDVSSTAACARIGPPTPVVGGGSASPASHAPCRSALGQGSKVHACLGFRPADGLFVEPRWDYVVSYSLGGVFSNKVYATLEIRA